MTETQFESCSRSARDPTATVATGHSTGRRGSRRDQECALLGIGVAVPGQSLGQAAAADFAAMRCAANDRQNARLRHIYRHSGVNRRASVLLDNDGVTGLEQFYPAGDGHGPTTAVRMQRYAATAGALGARASRDALVEANVRTASITHIVTVSCTGFVSPGIDAELIEHLGLSPDVGRLNLGFMGCHGALNGLRAAQGLARQPGACVLLCCIELCSLHFQYGWNLQNVVANALFADGAGAAIIGDGRCGGAWRLTSTASRIAPASGDAITWRIGDHGFEMTLSRDVPRLIRGAAADWVGGWLAEHDLSIADVAHWAIHPGGPKIIESVLDSLSLPESAGAESRAVLAEHGNMSSPTVLFILDRLQGQAVTGPCVALGFGPGLALEAALFN